MLIVDHRLPKGVFVSLVHERIGIHVLEQVFVSDGQGQFPLEVIEVLAKRTVYRVDRFLLLLLVILAHRSPVAGRFGQGE